MCRPDRHASAGPGRRGWVWTADRPSEGGTGGRSSRGRPLNGGVDGLGQGLTELLDGPTGAGGVALEQRLAPQRGHVAAALDLGERAAQAFGQVLGVARATRWNRGGETGAGSPAPIRRGRGVEDACAYGPAPGPSARRASGRATAAYPRGRGRWVPTRPRARSPTTAAPLAPRARIGPRSRVTTIRGSRSRDPRRSCGLLRFLPGG